MNIEKQLLKHLQEKYFGKFSRPLNIQSTQTLGGGCISQAMKLDTNQGAFFLKWNSSGPDDLFLREAESLNELLKTRNEVLVFPEPILAEKIGQLPGYLLTSYLEPGNSYNDDEQLGHGLALLHQYRSAEFGFRENNYCGASLQDNSPKKSWIGFYSQNRIGKLLESIRASRAWSAGDEKTAEKFLQKVPALLSHPVQPSLIHGDLWSGNYLYTGRGPALIDPCVSYCDREFELGIMTMFGGFSQRVYDAYNETDPLPAGWRDRNLIYQLYHVLNHYLLFGGFYKNQAIDIMKRFL